MARRSGRGSRRRARTPSTSVSGGGLAAAPLPPLPRSTSSSSSRDLSEDSMEEPLVPPSSASSSSVSSSNNTTGVRLVRSRSSSSFTSKTSSSNSQAIAPPAFLKVLHDANAPVIGVNVDGIVTLWNTKVETITGFNAAQVVGQPLQDYIVGASRRDAVERSIHLAFQDRTSTLEVNIPLRTVTGRNATIVTSVTPLLSDDGTPLGVYGIGQDVTERRIHETHYANVIMQANAPIIELDPDANITVWNAKAASLTGFDDVLGKPLLPMVDERYRDEVSRHIQHSLSGVAGGDFELPLITNSGSRVEIAVCLTPRVDVSGDVNGIVAIGQDVTERNAKEMEYRKFIDSANAPIFGVDLCGSIVIFNKKAVDTSEYSAGEVLGKNLIETLISEDYRETVAAVLQNAFEGVQTANVEFPLVTKSGRKVEILLNATPRYDHLGKLCGAIGIGQDITDRIIQEQEYSRLIDTANAPIFGVDREFDVIIWNRKAANLTQYCSEEMMGEDILQYISPEHRNAFQEVLKKALNGVETANVEFSLVTKSGRKLDVLLNATPKYDHCGNVCGVVGIGQDISDRRTQEQEYTRLIDTANAPIFGVDKEGRVNIWNRKAAQITEYSVFDVLGANLVENFIPTEYKKEVGAVLSRALAGEEKANFEFPLITRTGRRVEILLNATPRHDEKGAIIGVVGIGQDITVRIAQEQEYSRLIDTANAPIFGVDMKGLVNIWNKKAAEITQFSTEEVIGHDLVNGFVSEENRAAVSFALRKALQGAQTANFDFPLITKTGRRVEILLNATPRYNELGNIVGVVGIGQDITERIAQEQEYIRLIDTANAPIFGVNDDGRVNIWNKKAAEITQYTQSDVMGENLVEKFITEDYREAVGYVLSKALNGTETANFEFPLITKTGRRVEILLNATPRFNEHGTVIGMVGIGQDITDRIAQEQEYTRLIDTANAPIFGVNAEGQVNIWNKKAAAITQYTAADVMGERLVDKFITEDYREAVGQVLSKALDGVETANFEFPLMTKTGRRVEILLNATPRFNEHGKVMGMVGIGQDITDRLAQEHEYTRLIDSANAPIFGVDVDGCVTIWNKKAAEITQYTTSDVMGENLVEKFITEDYREAVAQVLSKALDGLETANFEFPLMTKTGRRVEILLNATSRFNEHGKVIGMVGIGQDITDRIAQEQEYSRLIDTANAPIFGVDVDMRVNIWNKKAAQITNYSIDEVIGENLVETFISPEFRPLVSAVLSKALQGIQTANFEFPLITRPGTRIEILLNATPRMDSNGNIVGVVGIGQDITERIAQEDEYMRLIDTANAPIFGIKSDGCINEWNQKIAEITGYHQSEVLGISLVNTLIIPESRKQVSQLLNQALIGIDVGEMELPMTTKNGAFLLLLVNASSKKDTHGNIRGVIGVGQDYTARKHMEAAKVNFLASFSHELRTPLNGVLGMLELLKEMKLDSVSERYVHIGYVSGSLLLNLINDILDLSKIEAGHMEILSAPFHMQDLLDYSIEIFNLRARERGLVLEHKCDDAVPKIVIGDVFRLRQVLLNLLSNAVKFTNAGSIVVSCSKIRSTDLPPGHVKLLFQVSDTGIGMDKEEKSRLFSLFTKLERTRQNNPTGSGLGLAICKQLVELMDGSIDVESELGVGSNFYFTVVVQVADEDDARKSSLFGSDDLVLPSTALLPKSESNIKSNDSNESSGPLVVVPAKARILVVEDNDFNWEVLKCFLQEDDHFLQWEVNGRNAVNAYIQNHMVFDLIFMDCEMPVMDGYAATNMIRQFEQEKGLPRIPILGLTAYAMNGDRQKCLDAGMDEFMVKPISKMTLRRAIRQWMKVRYLGAPQPSTSTVSTKTVASTPSPSSKLTRAVSNTPLRDSFVDGGVPSYPNPRASLDGVDEEIRAVVSPPKSARLAPASQHMQQLDLTRAIANLELDDPLAMNRRGGRSVRTGVPSTSIFSLGTPLSTNHTRSSSGSLLTFQRDASGAIVEVPDWSEPKDKTSNTLPTGKSSPLYHPDLTDQIAVKRASYPKTPMIWTQQMMKQPPTSPIAVKLPARVQNSIDNRGSGSITDDDQDGDDDDDDHDAYSGVPPLSLAAGSATYPGRQRSTTDTVSSMSPMDIEIPDGDPVNYALGVEQCGDREELFLDLLEKFCMGCDAAMERIESAYTQRDMGLLKREAHSLKGSSAYVAALRVSKSAYRVQLASQCLVGVSLSQVDPSMVTMLDSTMAALRKEHKLLRGYIRRNFAFRSTRTATNVKDDRSRDKPPANACAIM